MCGLVALFRRNGEPVGEREIGAMSDLIIHRGPDGRGALIDGSVGLGFRRLVVIDPSGGRQPMSNDRGTVHLVFNGEIYNYRGLRRMLQSRGVRLRSQSDTETILGLYELFGVRCVDYLHGMFAFVVWDAERRRLFAARDRLGIKPLYLLRRGATVALASEIKAFLPLGGWTPRLAPEALAEYLVYRSLAGTRTLFQDVERVAPGEMLVFTADGERRERYWELPVPGGGAAGEEEPRGRAWVGASPESDGGADAVGAAGAKGEADAGGAGEAGVSAAMGLSAAGARTRLSGGREAERWCEELHDLLDKVVREHLVSDVPLGTFNSGGVDSSLVTALAVRNLQGGSLNTYSVGFADPAFDESPYAGLVARQFGTDHHKLEMDGGQFAEWLPRAVWYHDEPLNHPHCVPLLLLCRLAKQKVTVVLTGEGSDELFAGYRRYRLPALIDRVPLPLGWLRLALALFGGAAGAARGGCGGGDGAGRRNGGADRNGSGRAEGTRRRTGLEWLRAEAMLRHGRRGGGVQVDGLAAFVAQGEAMRVLAPLPIDGAAAAAERGAAGRAVRPHVLSRALWFDQQNYLQALLLRLDKMAMAASVEGRVPFLDHRLVELAARIPPGLKVRGLETKYLLKQVGRRYLPGAIIGRRKAGFAVPIGDWMRPGGPLAELCAVLLEPRSLERGYLEAARLRGLVEEHRSGRADHHEILWALLNLELWQRLLVEGGRRTEAAADGSLRLEPAGAPVQVLAAAEAALASPGAGALDLDSAEAAP